MLKRFGLNVAHHNYVFKHAQFQECLLGEGSTGPTDRNKF